jgi:hypothetical protein
VPGVAQSVRDERPGAPEDARRRRRLGSWLDLAALGAAAALVLAAALVGWQLKEHGVHIKLFFPPLLAEWGPHIGAVPLPALVVAVLVVAWGPRLAERLPWRAVTWLAYTASVAWTLLLALVDGWHTGIAGKLAERAEYLPNLAKVSSLPAMLRGFTSHILPGHEFTWTIHAGAHPPGALGVYVVLNRVGLGGGAAAGLVTILVGASAGVAVAVTLRALGTEKLARRMLPFAVLSPGAIWVGVSADGMFAGVVAWGVALLAIACAAGPDVRWRATAAALAGGLLLGLAPYLSYGLALAMLLPLSVIAMTRAWRPASVAVLGAALVVAGFTAGGFWWFEGYQLVKIDYASGIAATRPYGYFVWANIAALAFALGPAVFAGLRRWASGPARLGSAGSLLTVAAVVAIIVADVSGKSKGEVARIWLPFAVWLNVPTALLPRSSARLWLAAEALLALLVQHLLHTVW